MEKQQGKVNNERYLEEMEEKFRQYLVDLYLEKEMADTEYYIENSVYENSSDGERYKIINLSDDFKLESVGKFN